VRCLRRVKVWNPARHEQPSRKSWDNARSRELKFPSDLHMKVHDTTPAQRIFTKKTFFEFLKFMPSIATTRVCLSLHYVWRFLLG
jgi:hypothetical protein